MKQFKKLSEAQKRDFKYYCSRLPKTGSEEPISPHITADSLAQWFWLWDTHGIRAKYKYQSLCWRLVQAKEELNLTIKLWVEDIVNESCILHPKEVWEWCDSMPKWVWKSFVHQLNKHHLPFKWMRAELCPFQDIYWPPEQIEFDPSI